MRFKVLILNSISLLRNFQVKTIVCSMLILAGITHLNAQKVAIATAGEKVPGDWLVKPLNQKAIISSEGKNVVLDNGLCFPGRCFLLTREAKIADGNRFSGGLCQQN